VDAQNGLDPSAAGFPPAAPRPASDSNAPVSASTRAASASAHDGVRLTPARARLPLATFLVIGLYLAVEGTFHALAAAGLPAAREWALVHFGQSRRAVWDGEYYRLLTCTVLHGGLFHVAVNAVAVLLFGRIVERWIGGARFLACVVVFGFGGSLSYQAFSDDGIGVGASGAVCGLVGLFLVGRAGRRANGYVALGPRFWKWILFAVALLFADSLLAPFVFSGVAIADSAHFGGLAFGVVGGAYLLTARGGAGARRRARVGLAGSALAVGLGSYALAFPVFDWSWYLWRVERVVEGGDFDRDLVASLEERARYFGGDRAAARVIALRLGRGEIEESWAYWRRRPLDEVSAQAEAGFLIYDALFVEGYRDKVPGLLDELIELTDRALASHPDDPTLINNAAWYRAQRRKDLDRALELATRALDLRPGEPSFLNTLGWVHFVRGEAEAAFRYLSAAVEPPREEPAGWRLGLEFEEVAHRSALGANYLYLGIALWERGQVIDARRAAISARRLEGELHAHERALLRELEASLGNGGV